MYVWVLKQCLSIILSVSSQHFHCTMICKMIILGNIISIVVLWFASNFFLFLSCFRVFSASSFCSTQKWMLWQIVYSRLYWIPWISLLCVVLYVHIVIVFLYRRFIRFTCPRTRIMCVRVYVFSISGNLFFLNFGCV